MSRPVPAHAAEGGRRRLRSATVVALALVVATVVALLLAQSAGAVHLSILGGTGASPARVGPPAHDPGPPGTTGSGATGRDGRPVR